MQIVDIAYPGIPGYNTMFFGAYNNNNNNNNINHNNTINNNNNNNHNNNNNNNHNNDPIINDASNPLKGKILFSTTPIRGKLNLHVRDFEIEGFYIVYENQFIKYNRLSDTLDEYIFTPSNTYLRINREFCEFSPSGFLYAGSTNFHSKYEFRCDELNPKLDELKRFLDILIIKQKGREILSLLRVGKNRGLPHNMEAAIGHYITGKPGNIEAQLKGVKQNANALAPRLAGGKRKTRKFRK
jgi:hypothetical protein